MKVWITRTDAATLAVQQEAALTLWVSKPVFDPAPRGRQDSQFACEPIGWTASAGCWNPAHPASLRCLGLKHEPAALQPVWSRAMTAARETMPPGVICPQDGLFDIDAMFALPTGQEAAFCLEVELDAAAARAVEKRLQLNEERRRQDIIARRTGRKEPARLPF